MLYLIIPVLFENGFYQEVSKLNKQLIRFHQSAQKDGLDMMGRSFEFGNYMKAIELKNFTLRCKRYFIVKLFDRVLESILHIAI